MNSDRLSNLHLLPPQAASIWTTSPMCSPVRSIKRADDSALRLELPLFWYEPPWIQLPIEVAGRLAASVANLDVVVSALHRDVADDGQPGEFFSPIQTDDAALETQNKPAFLPRMTPYRAERYGFSAKDFDDTRIIDVRLAASRDSSGRFAYSPEQMQRWERAADHSSIGGGGYVASSSFPSDVVSLSQARVKLDQLRQLAPAAAIFVSIGCFSIEEEINAALVSRPDGMIIRMDQPEIEGIQLAALVRRARVLMDEGGFTDMPLWVVPGAVTARDVAKLMALGASAVAIDCWCNPLVEFLLESLPTSRYDRTSLHEIPAVASQHLWDDINSVIGFGSTISPSTSAAQRLGTYHPRWAKACGVSLLTI